MQIGMSYSVSLFVTNINKFGKKYLLNIYFGSDTVWFNDR